MKNNGRECCQHEVCGMHLLVGEVVKLVPTIISNVNETDEDAIAVHRVMDGIVGCRVGFIPRVQANMLHRRNVVPTTPYAIVKDVYSNSSNKYKLSKSKRNYGMACCVFFNNMPRYE